TLSNLGLWRKSKNKRDSSGQLQREKILFGVFIYFTSAIKSILLFHFFLIIMMIIKILTLTK
ncbi:MAG: hypothetical protein ACTSRZ_08345, partial [Promethearchaeota archaeon]